MIFELYKNDEPENKYRKFDDFETEIRLIADDVIAVNEVYYRIKTIIVEKQKKIAIIVPLPHGQTYLGIP